MVGLLTLIIMKNFNYLIMALMLISFQTLQASSLQDFQKMIFEQVNDCIDIKSFKIPSQQQIVRCLDSIDMQKIAKKAQAMIPQSTIKCYATCINGDGGLTPCLLKRKSTVSCIKGLPDCLSKCS